MTLDLLVLAAHPDDAELSVGGLLLQAKARGHRTGILDLTRAELSSRGNLEQRAEETERASEILGLDFRENLGLPDGEVRDTHAAREMLVEVVRKTRPLVLLAPWRDDLHPDHANTGLLAWRSLYQAGIVKFASQASPTWRPQALGYYMCHTPFVPDTVVDVSPFWEDKVRAVLAYRSQFNKPDSVEPPTKISSPNFMKAVEGRAREYGLQVGCEFGEPLVWQTLVRAGDLIGQFERPAE